MIPILFAEAATTFNTNGIGRLADVISCVVTEERNGLYELEMEYPTTGKHYSDIGQRKIIVAQPAVDSDLQPFRVYRITTPLNGKVKIYAQHISYDLSKNVAMPFTIAASASACSQALAGLKTNAVETCPFTFTTDVDTNAAYTQTAPASIRSRLGGVEGSILDQFGGEYEFDGYNVILHEERGDDNGVTLRYGKNITDISQEENISNTVTGVVPYWQSFDKTTIVTLPERAVYSTHASSYSTKLTVPLDLSSENQPTEADLRAAAQAYVNKTGLGVPKVSVNVSFIDLRGTAGYEDVAQLETVHLCDTVTVQFVPLGIDTKAEVVKCVYDALKERYESVTIGSLRSTLATTINDQNNTMAEMVEKQGTMMGQVIDKATAWLTSAGGYVIAIKDSDGTWKELVFSDKRDPYDATAKILRINNNGLGFSSTGMNGTFTNAWTIDGNLIADFIHGGTLTLGGNNNVNGALKIVNASGTQIGKWDKDGISASNGSFSGSISGSTISGGTITGATVSGSTVKFGSSTQYVELKGVQTTSPLGTTVYELDMTSANGAPIYIQSSDGTNYSSIYIPSSGDLVIHGQSKVNITSSVTTTKGITISSGNLTLSSGGINSAGVISGNSMIVAVGEARAEGRHLVQDVLNGTCNIGVFEANGNKYLGIYNGTSVVGNIQITTS